MDYRKTVESFVLIAKLGSFARAAEQAGMSRTLMTRHIMDLEKRLGVRLFNRTTRQLALTERGEKYLECCSRVLSELEQTEAEIRQLQNEPEGELRVLAPKSFGGLHFADAVIEFARRHPRLRISLFLEDAVTRTLNFASNDFDVAIRLSPLPDSSATVVRKIGRLEWVVCAAPSYLEKHGTPKQVQDLERFNCLLQSALAPERVWRFGSPKNRVSVKVSGTFLSNSAMVIRSAVISGLGIAQLPTYYIGEDLAQGRLRRIPLQPGLEPRPVYALLPANRFTPKKSVLFVSFLAKWFRNQTWTSRTNAGY